MFLPVLSISLAVTNGTAVGVSDALWFPSPINKHTLIFSQSYGLGTYV